jgi:probable phosphoglycerate mutase
MMSTLPGTTGRRRIYLMRHGHVNYFSPEVARTRNTNDVVLTEQGRLEACAAGRALADIVFDRAICSGYPRTRETAELVLSASPAPPPLEIESGLVEIHGGRIGGDRGFGIGRAEIIATMTFHFARAADEGATMLDGGEAFAGAQDRAVAVIKRLLGEPDWTQILVVAHEGAGLRSTHAFEQDTGCINVVDFDIVPSEGGGTEIARALIKAVNLTPYNYLKHGMNLTSLEAIFAQGAEER